MGGIMGGGAPATYSQGGNPAAYIPTAQPQADVQYQNIVNSILGSVGPAGQTSPGAAGYAQAQPIVSQLGQIPQTIQGYTGLQGWALPNFFAGAGAQPAMDLANYGATTGAGYGLTGAGLLQNAGQNILTQAFDPQNALYNQLKGTTLENAAVANAGAGLGASPYGASTTANALSNFDINWQKQKLANEIAGGQAAAGILGGVPSLAATSGGLPYSVGATMGNNLLSALNQAIGGQSALGTSLGNELAGITSAANLGNNQFQIPQQILSDLQSYLQLGQAGSSLAGQLGQIGFNQGAQGIGGLISGLGGINSLTGGGITNALGLGGGAGAGSLFAGLTPDVSASLASGATAIPTAADIASAGAFGGGGGGGLLSALPFTGAGA